MAGIDKIYGTTAQWEEFWAWAEKQPRALRLCESFYPRDGYTSDDRPITNFTEMQDRWVWDNCKIPFVVKRLREQYAPEGPDIGDIDMLWLEKHNLIDDFRCVLWELRTDDEDHAFIKDIKEVLKKYGNGN